MSTALASLALLPLFGEACNHAPVAVRRLHGARLLWLNRRALLADAQFAAFGGDIDACGRHILEACAYEVDPTPALPPNTPLGFADRYGGTGIGHNGGSGRAIHLNGFHIKGVGRTPLVSCMTDPMHASGGAYLEECVRETILAEVVAAEFPHGAVPTLAIIDTGITQTWDTVWGPKVERRTLLVRPCFLRPAHFERAIGFVAGAPKQGAQDHVRVGRLFETAAATMGSAALLALYESFWRKWARQLAYSFVHRLPHGSHTTSNISFDGRLVDFGSMGAVPSWANTATVLFYQPLHDQFGCVERAISSLSYYFGRHFDSRLAQQDTTADLITGARKAYQQTLVSETLRLCGVAPAPANAAASDDAFEALWAVLAALIAHYQAEEFDMVYMIEAPKLPWDIPLVWAATVPQHLKPLRRVLDGLVPLAERAAAAARCAAVAASRPLLYGYKTKDAIYAALEGTPASCHAEDTARIAALIDRYVSQNVRGVDAA